MTTSKLYKLVLDNRIVAEGNKPAMKKKLREYNREPLVKARFPFVGIGSPASTLGEKWNKSLP